MTRFLLALLLSLALPALAGPMEEQARRQLEFAEAELAEGQYERARKSASSAKRLDATLHVAWVIKALAYEAEGEFDLAQAMLLAYIDERGGMAHDPRVADALERIQAGRKGGRTPKPRPRPDPIRPGPAPAPTPPPDDLPNPEAVQASVEAAIKAGKCDVAFAEATELRASWPGLALGAWLVANSHRCAGRNRHAVLALREWVELGGDDRGGLTLLRSMADQLSVLVVHVDGIGDVVPRVSLEVGDHLLTVKRDEEGFVFRDLPPESAPTVRAEGRGFEALSQTLEPLLPARRREVTVKPTYIGLATVRVIGTPKTGVALSVAHGGDVDAIGWGESRVVTAGSATVSVSSEFGTVPVEMELAADATERFDPTPWLPAAVTLIGLPAGSRVRVFVSDDDGHAVEREFDIPAVTGETDPTTGVRLAPSHLVDSVIGGAGGVFVEHPVLGKGATELTVISNEDLNATTFKWGELPGVNNVRGRYEVHRDTRIKLIQRRDGGIGAGLAVAIGSAVTSGILWGAAFQEGAERRAANDAVIAAQAACGNQLDDCSEFHNQSAIRDAARDAETQLVVAGSVTSGAAAIGVLLTGVFGGTGQKAVKDHGDWEGQ